MKPVIIPTPDVNSDSAIVVAWFVEVATVVDAPGLPLVEIETSKAAYRGRGARGRLSAAPGPRSTDEVSISEPVALRLRRRGGARRLRERARRSRRPQAAAGRDGVRAIVKAREAGRRSSASICPRLDDGHSSRSRTSRLPRLPPGAGADSRAPRAAERAAPACERVSLIGAGLGATQVIDIFADLPGQQAVASSTTTATSWGAGRAASRSSAAPTGFEPCLRRTLRRRDHRDQHLGRGPAQLRELCAGNADPAHERDRPARRSRHRRGDGRGNVICAFCHFGTETRVGDNNFFSAYNSFDHHNVLGTDVSTGPGCLTSGGSRSATRCASAPASSSSRRSPSGTARSLLRAR